MVALKRSVGSVMYYETEDALDDGGYVVMLKTNGKVAKCTADTQPFGINYMSTKHPITGTAQANVKVGIITEGVAEVQYNLADTDSDINIGDLVGTLGANAAGTVKKLQLDTTDAGTLANSLKCIVGVALESVSAPASGTKTGKLKVLLRIARP